MKKSIVLAALLSLSFATGSTAFAQGKDKNGFARLPVVNSNSGRIEAFLELQAQTGKASKGKWRLGVNSLDDVFGIDDNASLALVCSPKSSLSREVSGLGSNNCILSSLTPSARKQDFSAYFANGKAKLGLGARTSNTSNLPGWMTGTPANQAVKQNDLAFFAERNVGSSGIVSIAGTTAKAKLVPAAAMPVLADEWNTQSLRLSGGYGGFRADVVGRVVTVAGQPAYEGVDLGVTWRTPWSGQLSVGAENVITNGKNPFSVKQGSKSKQEGAVPYVRYKQDL